MVMIFLCVMPAGCYCYILLYARACCLRLQSHPASVLWLPLALRYELRPRRCFYTAHNPHDTQFSLKINIHRLILDCMVECQGLTASPASSVAYLALELLVRAPQPTSTARPPTSSPNHLRGYTATAAPEISLSDTAPLTRS